MEAEIQAQVPNIDHVVSEYSVVRLYIHAFHIPLILPI